MEKNTQKATQSLHETHKVADDNLKPVHKTQTNINKKPTQKNAKEKHKNAQIDKTCPAAKPKKHSRLTKSVQEKPTTFPIKPNPPTKY